MRTPIFTGTGTALVTPFKKDLSVDFDALGRLIDMQIEQGIEAVIPCGSTGEGATLSTDEKCDVIRFTIERVAGRIPVVAGTGSNDTQATIRLTARAREMGADGVLLVCPYYNKPTQQGLFEHHRAIAEAVDIPQILYNVPSRSGTNMTVETQLRIAEECPNVVAIKEASANLEQIAEIIRSAPEGFLILSGDDSLALPVIACGGKGSIAVISNYAPKQYGDLVRAALSGDFATAREHLFALLPLMKLNFIESNPIPAKAILAAQGLIEEIYRLPLTPLQPENRTKVEQGMRAAGLL
jgi:4-hydroxy-tetrahydrodipicolinate synthase